MLLVFASGCRSSRSVTIEMPSGQSAINMASDTTLIDPPPLRPLPRFDFALSAPLEVQRFRSLRDGPQFDVQRLIVDRTGGEDEIVIETPSARYRFRAPARGERLEISNRADAGRADQSSTPDSLLGSVTGQPEAERFEVKIKDRDGIMDQWLRLVKWIAAVIVLCIVAVILWRLIR